MRQTIARLPIIVIPVAVVVLFWPFFLQGLHVVPFHFEPASVTAIPGGGNSAAINYGIPWDASPILLHYPNAALTGDALRSGHLPTWNPYQGCGTPALGSGQAYPFSPFLWPFYLFPNPWAYTLGLILGCLFGAWGAALWLGRLGLKRWMLLFGTALTIINPWSVRNLVYSHFWTGWWFGWLLWSWERTLDPEERNWWLPALMIAGTVYSGHPETALLLTAGSFLYAAVAWAVRPRNQRSSSFWVQAAGVAALAGMLTAVHWLPVIQNLKEALPYKLFLPKLSTDVSFGFASLVSPRSDVYLSPLLWGLGLMGLLTVLRERRLWAPLAVLSASIVFLFHPWPGRWLYWLLTLGGVIPAFYGGCLFAFVLAPIVAVGARRFAEEGGDRRRRLLIPLSLGLLPSACYFLWDLKHGDHLAGLVRPEWLAFVSLMLILGFAAAWARPGRFRRIAVASMLTLAVLDPFVLGFGYLKASTPFEFVHSLSAPHRSFFNRLNPLAGGPPAIKEARGLLAKGHGRFWSPVVPSFSSEACLAPDLATLWRLRDIRIQDVLLLQRYVVLQQAFWPKNRHEYFTLLAFAGGRPGDLASLGVSAVGIPLDAESGRFRWETIPDACPRAFLVHSVVASRNELESYHKWLDLRHRGLLGKVAVLEGWHGSAEVGHPDRADRVSWLEDGLTRVRVRVSASSPAVLVLLDSYADGWKARIGRRTVSILPADLAFRAVIVPPGVHEVQFDYAPRSVREGLLTTIGGWLVVVLLAGVTRKSRREAKNASA